MPVILDLRGESTQNGFVNVLNRSNTYAVLDENKRLSWILIGQNTDDLGESVYHTLIHTFQMCA